ncbi:histidinol phosphate phosphatase domain-containing protein [Methanocella arvoryzae]|uniref:Predicted metal-dependent phosphoesterase (PHP family) n=1 Tax=Methanocella arvoryzae (strain DSM 22066 / NBRC 105507 / MRE50) TaxID=351160 RepID=Q0W300_METAR|nr:histidinol phosphate phosphatase domain-containing protein [Methanocella arvoryzae]CAJ37243.1 predicted metal-dependent phosphoesterase (PHP family) [Methanocella arvoryzae MRE50]
MIDLHTHSLLSDGELLPSELVRRAKVIGYEAIAITDHADYTNLERLIDASKKARVLEESYGIVVISGVELTHLPPEHIAPLAKRAKELGAEIVVVHGETPAEPVAPGTNKAAVSCKDVDVLAHPGFLTLEEARLAASNGILLEITSRGGHNMTNGYVANTAREAGAMMVVDTDSHAPGDLITGARALAVARGAGLSEQEAALTRENAVRKLNLIVGRR